MMMQDGRFQPLTERIAAVMVSLACLTVLSGCGGSGRPKLRPVEGTVMLNGEPLADATVHLQPVTVDGVRYGRPSSGTTDAQGKFSLGTYGTADGVPEGKYNVAVIKQEPVGGSYPENYDPEQPERTPFRMSWITPRKYGNPQTSGLQIEINADGMQPAQLNLESSGKPEVELVGARPRGDGT